MFDLNYLITAAKRDSIRRAKDRGFELLALNPGEKILDIGCGPAIDTIRFAHAVGSTGRVVGIDANIAAVSLATEAAMADRVDTWTDHLVGDCRALQFPNNAFDACYCERVFQHLSKADAIRTGQETARILRSEGRVCCIDTDWPSMSVHSPAPIIERLLIQLRLLNCRNPYAARGLPELFHLLGLREIRVETIPIELSSQDVIVLLRDAIHSGAMTGVPHALLDAWMRSIRDLDRLGCFYAGVNFVIVFGKTTR